jgi:hypothetical protein
VQLARDHFLADAALAAQQHDVTRGHALDHRSTGCIAARTQHVCAVRILRHLRAESRHFGAQRFALGIANRGLERRFADAVGIAGLRRSRRRRAAASTIVAGVDVPTA